MPFISSIIIKVDKFSLLILNLIHWETDGTPHKFGDSSTGQ